MWPGATSVGYGRIGWTQDGKKTWGAVHRVMYADRYGQIPTGLDIDHKCHDPEGCRPGRAIDCPHRRCCNPEHLGAVSRRENLLRGGTVAASRASVVECPAGHRYTPENTIVDRKGRRQCRKCTRRRNNDYAARHREQKSAYNKAYYAKRKASR